MVQLVKQCRDYKSIAEKWINFSPDAKFNIIKAFNGPNGVLYYNEESN